MARCVLLARCRRICFNSSVKAQGVALGSPEDQRCANVKAQGNALEGAPSALSAPSRPFGASKRHMRYFSQGVALGFNISAPLVLKTIHNAKTGSLLIHHHYLLII